MTTTIRFRRAPSADWEYAELRGDPFEICEKVQERIFPDIKPLDPDPVFDRIMSQRRAGAPFGEREGLSSAAAASTTPARPGVRDTSMLAYRTLEWNGKLTRQQKLLVDFLAANPQRDYTRTELSNGTDLPINTICGRVKELLDRHVLEEIEPRRECRITGASANPLRLAQWMRKAA